MKGDIQESHNTKSSSLIAAFAQFIKYKLSTLCRRFTPSRRAQRSFILMVFSFVFVMSACLPFSGSPPPTPTPVVPTPTPGLVEVTQNYSQIEGEFLKEGVMAITVNARDSNTALNIHVISEGGIIFSSTAPLNTTVSMLPYESRQLLFPYQIDKTTTLSGEYVTRVQVDNSGILTEKRVKSFIAVKEPSNIQILPSQPEFDKLLSTAHYLTNTKLPIALMLDSGEQAKKGRLLVKVPSDEDGYTAQVTVSLQGGILFEEAPSVKIESSTRTAIGSVGPILASGSRILQFPFHIDPSSNDGIYSFTLALQSTNKEIVTDYFPVALKVSSSIVKQNVSWLSIQEIPLPPPTPLPSPTPTPSCFLIFCS